MVSIIRVKEGKHNTVTKIEDKDVKSGVWMFVKIVCRRDKHMIYFKKYSENSTYNLDYENLF